MHKLLIAIACAGVAVTETVAHAGLLSSTGAVIAILADELFVGEAIGHLSGAGTLAIRSQERPELSCHGQFTSSAALGGSGRMVCSDGATATFHFQRLSVLRGYGTGNFSRGGMSFAYGLTAEEAAPYLILPMGKKLISIGPALQLADR